MFFDVRDFAPCRFPCESICGICRQLDVVQQLFLAHMVGVVPCVPMCFEGALGGGKTCRKDRVLLVPGGLLPQLCELLQALTRGRPHRVVYLVEQLLGTCAQVLAVLVDGGAAHALFIKPLFLSPRERGHRVVERLAEGSRRGVVRPARHAPLMHQAVQCRPCVLPVGGLGQGHGCRRELLLALQVLGRKACGLLLHARKACELFFGFVPVCQGGDADGGSCQPWQQFRLVACFAVGIGQRGDSVRDDFQGWIDPFLVGNSGLCGRCGDRGVVFSLHRCAGSSRTQLSLMQELPSGVSPGATSRLTPSTPCGRTTV